MKAFVFCDGHSGGYTKNDFEWCVVYAENEASARAKFKEKTECDSFAVTCECCGPDFWVDEYTEEELVEYRKYANDNEGETIR